jgi:hypothetical protein
MQMPKFTKITTDGHPAYRFEHDGKTFEAFRYASGAGAWNVDRIEGEQRTAVVRGKDTRAAAVTAVIDAPQDEQPAQPDGLGEAVAELEAEDATDTITAGRLTFDTVQRDMRIVCHSRGGLLGTVREKYAAGFGVDRPVVRIAFDGGAEAYNYPEQLSELVYRVEVDRHVQARPRVFEDRYAIYQHGLADPVERFALPYRSDRSDRDTLAVRGWSVVGELEYIAGPNVFRGRVAPVPVAYGNAGHWISAHVVDPAAAVPAEPGFVAEAKCGDYLIATYDTPRGHALCVACTGDPVEVNHLRDSAGWLKDGGRPVKVLRALSLHDRIIASVETTDDKPREWHDVRCDATAPEVIFAPEEPATRDEIRAGTLVEAVVISTRPTVQQWRVDRAPWGGDRDTILSDGRGVVAVWTNSLRVIEQPAEAHAD